MLPLYHFQAKKEHFLPATLNFNLWHTTFTYKLDLVRVKANRYATPDIEVKSVISLDSYRVNTDKRRLQRSMQISTALSTIATDQ